MKSRGVVEIQESESRGFQIWWLLMLCYRICYRLEVECLEGRCFLDPLIELIMHVSTCRDQLHHRVAPLIFPVDACGALIGLLAFFSNGNFRHWILSSSTSDFPEQTDDCLASDEVSGKYKRPFFQSIVLFPHGENSFFRPNTISFFHFERRPVRL